MTSRLCGFRQRTRTEFVLMYAIDGVHVCLAGDIWACVAADAHARVFLLQVGWLVLWCCRFRFL
jgi:hypothetical protein